jgi:asparagine synthetase B (glutamine-hydrolysing)
MSARVALAPGSGPDPVSPTSFEIATGFVLGHRELAVGRSSQATPRAALEDVIRPALQQSPCMVAFSGGRDSSALLAVAIALARREGLPEPVALTLDFAGSRTAEREWQELMVEHLGAQNWLKVQVESELDLVGPVAADGLRRHGLLYPANAHVIVPMAAEARGGALLTGVGGDDVFGRWPFNDMASLWAGRRRPQRGDVRGLMHALAPRPVRAEILRRREPLRLPWIRPEQRTKVAQRLAMEMAAEPRTWQARMHWSARWRPWRDTADSLARLGSDHGATVFSPFLDPGFMAALGQAGGLWGWGNRTATMRALFSDVLPERLLARTAKAEFSQPLFGQHTHAFAARWNGHTGVDERLVDGAVIKQVWTAEQPHFLSAMALQAAWLASGDQ